MHLVHAVQHGQDEVGPKEASHDGEPLPLSIQRAPCVSLEWDASSRVLGHRWVAAERSQPIEKVP